MPNRPLALALTLALTALCFAGSAPEIPPVPAVLPAKPEESKKAVDDAAQLWIGSDAGNEAPWMRGPGEIWKASAAGAATLVLSGPLPAGMALGPGGRLFVADRHAGKIFFVTPEGTAVDFATFTDGDAPRTLAFAPVTPDTRRAGIAGDLFVVAIRRGVFRLNDTMTSTVYDPDGETLDAIVEAAEACPTGAITVFLSGKQLV